MPVIESSYKPKKLHKLQHIATIAPNFFKKTQTQYNRQRIETPDGDYLDLDISSTESKHCIVALHGLEGSTQSNYISRLSKFAVSGGFDFIGLNHRGCSGSDNRLYSSYHSGKTDDLDLVISKIEEDYEQIFIVGYSLGGNVLLKYLGENHNQLSSKIRRCVAISTPVDLKGCAFQMDKPKNRIYMNRFLKSLKHKTKSKMRRFGKPIQRIHDLNRCQSFYDYDSVYTAPAHGFKDAQDYWAQSSSKPQLSKIKVKTLLINAINDPFLSKSCYPVLEANQNEHFFLEIPKYGGHVGFASKKRNWLEQRILEFIKS